jgi:HEAT repeat protein
MSRTMFLMIALLTLGLDPAIDLSSQIGGKSIQHWIDVLDGRNPGLCRTAASVLEFLGPDAEPAVPALMRAATDADTTVRVAAMQTLAAIGPRAKAAIPLLLRAAVDADASVSFDARRALGAMGPEAREAIPIVFRVASNPDASIREYGIRDLARIGRPAIPQLIQLLKSPLDDVSERTVLYLETMGPDAADAVPALIREYRARRKLPDYHRYQLEALETLAHIGPAAREAAPFVSDALRADIGGIYDGLSRAETWALTRLQVPPIAILSDAAGDGNYLRATDAINLLGSLGPTARPAVPVLRDVMKKRGNDDRWLQAAEALSQIDPADESVARVLIEAIKDHETLSMGALARLGPRGHSALPSLLRDMEKPTNDGDRDGKEGIAKSAIVQALVWIDPEGREIVPALIRALRDADPDTRALAAIALGLFAGHSREAVMELAQALKSVDDGESPDGGALWDMAECSAKALARIGEKAEPALPTLVQLLASQSQRKREWAAVAIVRIGPGAKGATSALIRSLKDESYRVRISAASALGRIGPDAKTAVPSLIAMLGENEVEAIAADPLRVAAALALIRIDPVTSRRLVQKYVESLPALHFWARAYVSSALGVKTLEAHRIVRNLRDLLTAFLNQDPWSSQNDDLATSYPWSSQNDLAMSYSHYRRVESIIDELERFGRQAEEATPALQKLVGHPNPWIRQHAAATLHVIHPE